MESADKSILLQFAKFSKGFRISDFDEFVEEFIGVENLEFFGRLAYPNQWQMLLSNSDLRERLIRMGRTRINNRSCWMYPLNQQEIRGFVHWLPNLVTNDQLTEELKLYGNVLFIENQERTIKGRNVESDPRYYGLMLPHGTFKEDLPHFLKINGFLCHLVVRGREPACFHCKQVGHRRAECQKYKEKLISYCNRDPNSAPPRLKPRGRRHAKVETEVKTGEDEVSSSADTVPLEREVPVHEETTEPQSLPVMEDREYVTEVQEEAASISEKELTESGVFAELAPKSYMGIPAASFSETERQDIAETLKRIQQKIEEDLRERLQNFGKEIAQTFTRSKPSTCTKDQEPKVSEAIDTSKNLEQEISNGEMEKQKMEICAPNETFTPVEKPGEDSVEINIKAKKREEILHVEGKPSTCTKDQKRSTVSEATHTSKNLEQEITNGEMEKQKKEICAANETFTPTENSREDSVEININERKGEEILPTFPTMHQLKVDISETPEEISKETEEMARNGKTAEATVSDTIRSILLILEQTKETAVKTFERTFKKLEEFTKNLEEVELSTKEPAAYMEQKLDDEILSKLVMLDQAKQIASEYFENTFKKLEEEIASLSSQLTKEQTDTDPKLTKDDIQFAYEKLQKVKETAESTLENTFRKVTEKLGKVTESVDITTESLAESKSLPRIVKRSTQSAATLKQLKQEALDIVKHFDKEGMNGVEEAENSEKQSASDNSQKETIQSKSGPEAISQGLFKADKIFESSKESEKEAATKQAFIASKGLESHVPKATPENIDELQMNIKKVFATALAREELLPETRIILKQVELEINELVDEMKNKQ